MPCTNRSTEREETSHRIAKMLHMDSSSPLGDESCEGLLRGVASEITHGCDPFFRADTLFTPHDYRYSATHEGKGRDANRRVQAGTKVMSPPILSTNATSVSKATRAGTSRQHNIASALCAHAVAMEKREANRADIVARPVGHARSLFAHPKRRVEHGRRARP